MRVEDMKSRTDRYGKSIVLIRLLVGWVFLSEGIQNLDKSVWDPPNFASGDC